MRALLIFLLLPIFSYGTEVSTLSCTGQSLWMARKSLVEMVYFEALRYAKIKVGLYPEWTGPETPEFKVKCGAVKRELEKSGEASVLFTSLDSDLYRTIGSFSNSWVSHTGVAMKEEGQWVVYESRAPKGLSGPTPLCSFMRRSTNHRVAIAKPQVSLTLHQIEDLRFHLQKKLGEDYDFAFDLDDPNKQFCSKYVYESFQEIGIEFGTPVTVEDLYNQFSGSTKEKKQMLCFFQAWFEGLTLFKDWTIPARQTTPWQQRTLTPDNQYRKALQGVNDPNEPFLLIYDSK